MKKLNNKGFTLIELLAVITVLAIVSTISIYVMLDVVGKAKEKSYKVTINNVKNAAIDYLKENSNDIFFISSGDNEYQCITVGNLIDTGYFDKNVLKSPVNGIDTVKATDYIYLERDKNTKAITNSVYPTTDFSACDINTIGDIVYELSPSGWSKEKTLKISYKLKEPVGTEINQYKYTVTSTDEEENTSESVGIKGKPSTNNNANNTETLTVVKNGTMEGAITSGDKTLITKGINISKIDDEGPAIIPAYTGPAKVRNRVTIPILIADEQSGLDNTSISKDDFIVTIDGKKVPKDNIVFTYEDDDDTTTINSWYKLEISNEIEDGDVISYMTGPLEITINNNTILDMVGNGNKDKEDDKTIFGGIEFTDEFLIYYHMCAENNNDCKNKATSSKGNPYVVTIKQDSDAKILTDTSWITYTNRVFVGWTTDKSGESDDYNWTGWHGKWEFKEGENGISDDGVLNLYAMWLGNGSKITINYYQGAEDVNTHGQDNPRKVTCTVGSTCSIYSKSQVISGPWLTRKKYAFKDWTTNADGTTDNFAWAGWSDILTEEFAQERIKGDTLNLYAMWVTDTTPPTISVTYYNHVATFTCTDSESGAWGMYGAWKKSNQSSWKYDYSYGSAKGRTKIWFTIGCGYTRNTWAKCWDNADNGTEKYYNAQHNCVPIVTNSSYSSGGGGSSSSYKSCYCLYCYGNGSSWSGYIGYYTERQCNMNCRGRQAGWGWQPSTSTCRSSGGCFLANTKVQTIDGYKDIDKLKEGDLVLTYNENKKINEYQKVLKVFILDNLDENLYTLSFDDKTTLQVTSTHRFFIKRKNKTKWLATKYLKKGDYVMYSDQTFHKITKIQYQELTDTVYNLEVENTHNFYVGEQQILVHNVHSMANYNTLMIK